MGFRRRDCGGLVLISLIIIAIFAGCLLAASWTDLTSMTIPNGISLILLAGFFVVYPFIWQGWSDFGLHLLIAVGCFAIVVPMFFIGLMGGGDAKLMIATSVWWGISDLIPYLFYTVLAGGVLALVLILGRKFLPGHILSVDWLYRLMKDEKKMPYGLALAFGGFMTLPKSEIFMAAAKLM